MLAPMENPNIITHKVPWPQSIQGRQFSHELTVDGMNVGWLRVDRADRSSGTQTTWEAFNNAGERITFGRSSMREAIAAVEATL